MEQEQTFRIVVVLPKSEAEALARVARREVRNLRDQAYYLVRAGLIANGELEPAPHPKPTTEAERAYA